MVVDNYYLKHLYCNWCQRKIWYVDFVTIYLKCTYFVYALLDVHTNIHVPK